MIVSDFVCGPELGGALRIKICLTSGKAAELVVACITPQNRRFARVEMNGDMSHSRE